MHPLPPRPGAKGPQDDWSGITNQRLRRKLQNRCNQRAARQRRVTGSVPSERRFEPVDAGSSSSSQSPTKTDDDSGLSDVIHRRTEVVDKWLRRQAVAVHTEGGNVITYELDADTIRSSGKSRSKSTLPYALIEAATRSSKLRQYLYPLPADHLLTLIYYNVYRAILSNIAILGLDLQKMNADDYLSPFLPLSSSASSSITLLPTELRPTSLQRTVAHHAQVDIFPDPVMRDNFIRFPPEDFDDDEFCLDMVGSLYHLHNSSSEEAGFYVFSADSWSADSWEVTEHFVRKYPWLFHGAFMIERGTNTWRSKRGLAPLSFADILSGLSC